MSVWLCIFFCFTAAHNGQLICQDIEFSVSPTRKAGGFVGGGCAGEEARLHRYVSTEKQRSHVCDARGLYSHRVQVRHLQAAN